MRDNAPQIVKRHGRLLFIASDGSERYLTLRERVAHAFGFLCEIDLQVRKVQSLLHKTG